MTGTDQLQRDGYVLAERPTPGEPRPYEFPRIARTELDNGLTVLVADLPGRPLTSASILLPVGAVDEPDVEGGAAVLAARALTEGTERYDAVGLTEASERLGASLHAEAGWDATSIGVDVPAIVTTVDRSVRQWIEESHMVLSYLLAAVVLVHVIGALRHHMLKHNDVLRRMIWSARA